MLFKNLTKLAQQIELQLAVFLPIRQHTRSFLSLNKAGWQNFAGHSGSRKTFWIPGNLVCSKTAFYCLCQNYFFNRIPRTVYDTIREAILTCDWKPTQVSLFYRKEPKTFKKWKKEKLQGKKTDMLKSIGKQSGESAESVRKKKTKATVGRICRKGRF